MNGTAFVLCSFKSIFVHTMKPFPRKISRVNQLLLAAVLFAAAFVFNTAFAPGEKAVFTTAGLSSKKALKINGTNYKITVTKKCIETGEPPFDCRTTIKFTPAGLPDLVIHGDAYRFAAKDLNGDGKTEIITLASEHGNWRTVSINTMSAASKTSAGYWYRPVSEFLWYPGFKGEEGCDAQLFWLADTKTLKVLTTNSADKAFGCTDEKLLVWKSR